MSEIEFTLPTAQYGNVKIRATPEEFGISGVGDAAAIGVAYAVYLNALTQGLERGKRIDVDISQAVADVAAQKYATDEPHPIDSVSDEEAVEILKDLGATVVDEEPAPWNNKPEAQKKPWENGGTKPTFVFK